MTHEPQHTTMWFDKRLVMRASPIQGTGVFTTAFIAAGEPLMHVSGGIIYTTDDWHSGRVQLDGTKYSEVKIGDDLLIATPMTIPYYVNHSCSPNMLKDAALRDIHPGEEITHDYGLGEANPSYLLEPCNCGSSQCRGRVTGNDWKLPALQERYKGRFSPYIERLIKNMNVAE